MSDDVLNSLYIRIGKNISFLRKKQKLTQLALANEINISQSLVSQYETAKKHPSIEFIQIFSSYFHISLEELMFKNLNKSVCNYDVDNEYLPISKCANCTYFCYYIKEQNDGKYGVRYDVASFEMCVSRIETYNSASALLRFPEKWREYKATLKVDGRYAYLESHEFQSDFFFHLTFYYHRNKSNLRYSGGVGLMQRFDANSLPVSQYCIVSISKISSKKYCELMNFLKVKEDCNLQLPRRSFSSSSVLRLTKNLDKTIYDWLRQNNYIVKN